MLVSIWKRRVLRVINAFSQLESVISSVTTVVAVLPHSDLHILTHMPTLLLKDTLSSFTQTALGRVLRIRYCMHFNTIAGDSV